MKSNKDLIVYINQTQLSCIDPKYMMSKQTNKQKHKKKKQEGRIDVLYCVQIQICQ